MAIRAVNDRPARQNPSRTRQKIEGDKTPKIHPARFQEQEFATQKWRAMVPADDGLQSVLNPEYFAHVSKKMKRLCTIELVWEDASKFVELLVLDVGENWAKTEILRTVYLGRPVPVEPSFPEPNEQPIPPEASLGYEVKFVNYHYQWCVIRKSDGASLVHGLTSEEDAQKWLQDHLKTVSR